MSAGGLARLGVRCQNPATGMATLGIFCGVVERKEPGVYGGVKFPGIDEQIRREDEEMLIIIHAFMETR